MSKWQWKMDYCKKKGIPPAQKWAWDEAEKAYQHAELSDGGKTMLPRNVKGTSETKPKYLKL